MLSQSLDFIAAAVCEIWTLNLLEGGITVFKPHIPRLLRSFMKTLKCVTYLLYHFLHFIINRLMFFLCGFLIIRFCPSKISTFIECLETRIPSFIEISQFLLELPRITACADKWISIRCHPLYFLKALCPTYLFKIFKSYLFQRVATKFQNLSKLTTRQALSDGFSEIAYISRRYVVSFSISYFSKAGNFISK